MVLDPTDPNNPNHVYLNNRAQNNHENAGDLNGHHVRPHRDEAIDPRRHIVVPRPRGQEAGAAEGRINPNRPVVFLRAGEPPLRVDPEVADGLPGNLIENNLLQRIQQQFLQNNGGGLPHNR